MVPTVKSEYDKSSLVYPQFARWWKMNIPRRSNLELRFQGLDPFPIANTTGTCYRTNIHSSLSNSAIFTSLDEQAFDAQWGHIFSYNWISELRRQMTFQVMRSFLVLKQLSFNFFLHYLPYCLFLEILFSLTTLKILKRLRHNLIVQSIKMHDFLVKLVFRKVLKLSKVSNMQIQNPVNFSHWSERN